MPSRCRGFQMPPWLPTRWVAIFFLISAWLVPVQAMRSSQIRELRNEVEHMFYHGFDNYMNLAYPEDELRPLSCGSLTRDREHPEKIDINDVLGNYSLTLIDSLSTLAILSSNKETGDRPWRLFQDGVKDLVRLYGDGTGGPSGRGERERGFDVDSKVQVFETVIRGLGGLLSAHLFAVGDLPIRGYSPPESETAFARSWDKSGFQAGSHGIVWENEFVYDGQLLRLAHDLGNRLVPAFFTPTGLPYPRINLRYGVPFYEKSPLNVHAQKDGQFKYFGKGFQGDPEITETCSAGAGSLVLEFTTLSRLTGDGRFEELAKRAFWAVWLRRSDIGLIGSGIDAETGQWASPYTGIGAGVDSFFEYAFKSYILLSSGERHPFDPNSPWKDFDDYFYPLTDEHHSRESFLGVWHESHSSILRHLYRGPGYQHPHLVQGDLFTGATRAFWIDSLSAFYPGLLTLAGEIEEATELHLLATALWTRFSALPERWNVATGNIDNGLGWWGGRPEFIESTYYLYRATKDPWYLHVGEMVLRDIKRRCWTKCGWAGLQDVRNGELKDRMESFFLGETAKYMFLLYDPDHPLNSLDAPFVFSTEGHPLVVPKSSTSKAIHRNRTVPEPNLHSAASNLCEIMSSAPPFGISSTAGRSDIFHAASLARLHLMPGRDQVDSPILEYAHDHPSVTLSDLSSPSNYTFYPWTLPPHLVPYDATSSPMVIRPTVDISFPTLQGANSISPAALERVDDGILIKALSGMRLGMIQDVPLEIAMSATDGFRVQVINNIPLGKDEKVYISRELTTDIVNPTDPNFTQICDPVMLDIVIDVEPELFTGRNSTGAPSPETTGARVADILYDQAPELDLSEEEVSSGFSRASSIKTALSALVNHVSSIIRDDITPSIQRFAPSRRTSARVSLPAITSTGLGSAPLPDVDEAVIFARSGIPATDRLTWSSIYMAGEMCDERVSLDVVRNHQVLVIKRGGCSFSRKLRSIPAVPPSRDSLKLVIIVSYDTDDDLAAAGHDRRREGLQTDDLFFHARPFSSTTPPASSIYPKAALLAEPYLVRPHLDETQYTAGGFGRHRPISLVMVGGGEETYALLSRANGLGLKRRYMMRSQGVPVSNLYII